MVSGPVPLLGPQPDRRAAESPEARLEAGGTPTAAESSNATGDSRCPTPQTQGLLVTLLLQETLRNAMCKQTDSQNRAPEEQGATAPLLESRLWGQGREP